LSIIVKDKTVN